MGGKGLVTDSLSGVNKELKGKITLAASTLLFGHRFQLKRIPSMSSAFSIKSCKSFELMIKIVIIVTFKLNRFN
jgi:hypothetical protein